ncbi:MAG: DUF6265 family protein [Bacteroidota bacterium]
MNNNKDIFNSFREKAKHLEEMPSDQAWQRLEARLKEQRQPAKVRRLLARRWVVAASLLVVLSVLSVLSTFLVQEKASFAEVAESASETLASKELGEDALVMTDAIPYNVAQLNRTYATARIEEGNAGTKLRAAINYFYNDEPAENTEAESLSESSIQPESKMDVTPIIDTIVQSFDWLLGVWKGNVEEGTSVEKWQKGKDAFYGTGYVVQDTDTIFMERMKLVQKGEDWYYVLQLDAYSNSLAYKLAYYAEDQAIFTNREGKFPKQVILRRNTENEFSTQLVSSNGISLSPRELDFLTKRNVLLVDKAVRNLVKI